MKISTVSKTTKSVTESQQKIDTYSCLTSVDTAIDELVVRYTQLAEDFPDYQVLFEGLAAQMLNQKGQIAALRGDIMDDSGASAMAQGEASAKVMLDEGAQPAVPAPYIDQDEAIISLIQGEPCCSIESATESAESGASKEDILAWLSEHEQAARDFVSFFEGQARFNNDGELEADDSLSDEEIESWIYDHEDLADDYVSHFSDKDTDKDYIILSKESEDPDEAFLEYHYPDRLMAQGTFFGSQYPTALLVQENGKWRIEAMSAECSREDLKKMLDEQIDLLNAQ